MLKKAHPQCGKPHTIDGDFLLRDGKPEVARDAFREALVMNRTRFRLTALLQLDFQLADWTSLDADAARDHDPFPTQPEPYLYKGIALSQLERTMRRSKRLVMGRDLVVDNPAVGCPVLEQLGRCLQLRRNISRSDKAYDKALAMNADDASTLNNYAYYLSERNEQLDKAERMSKRSWSLLRMQPTYMDTYAWILFKPKKYSEARTGWRRP